MAAINSRDSLKTRKTLLFATVEDVENTFKTPGATEFMRAINVSLTPLVSETKTHDETTCSMGSRKKFLSNAHVALSFDVAVSGSGVAGVAPREDPILRCCGRSAVTDPDVSVSYQPVDSGYESVSISVFIDGNKHAIAGAKGKVSLKAGGTDFVILSFELVGLYIDPVQAEHPVSDCSGLIDPLPQSDALTSWSIDDFSAALYALSLTDGTNPTYRDLPGERGTTINQREVSGSCEFAAPKLETKDFFALANEATEVALAFDHGVEVGHAFKIRAAKVQVLEPNYGDNDGRRTNSLNLNVLPNAGHECTFIYE